MLWSNSGCSRSGAQAFILVWPEHERTNRPPHDHDCHATLGAAARSTRIFRTPLGVRAFSLIGVGILGLVTAFMIGAAYLAFKMQWGLGLFMTAIAGFMGALTGYVWRDLRGKLGLRSRARR